MSFDSLRLRLLLAGAAFILAAVALASLGLTFLFERHVERWASGELNAYLDQVIAGIDASPDGALEVKHPPLNARFERPLSGLYWQVAVEPTGPVLRSRSLWDAEIPVSAGGFDDRVAGPGGQSLFLVQRQIELPARLENKRARVVVALDAAEIKAAVWRFAAALIPFLVILGALLTAAAWVQIAVGLRPLAAMRQKLEAIGAGERRRLGAGFPDEVQPLAGEVDALLDARDRDVERARARAADLAHGLKTPLQILLGDVQRLHSEGKAEIAAEIEDTAMAMQRQVQRQLARARVAPFDGTASADIGEVAEQVVSVLKRTADGQRLSWSIEVPLGLKARIDPQDLAEALGNIAENAARHAKSRVTLSARADAGRVTLSIADDGPGIPREHQNAMLSRGARLDASQAGSGLGLAIVADIAEAWGCEIAFATEKRAFRVDLSLPQSRR